jgi:peptide-methionine (S)-S-oxide reductase
MTAKLKILGLAAALCLGVAGTVALADGEPLRLPAPVVAPEPAGGLRTATFAGGCFWGVQGVFAHVKGVKRAVSGYAGGLPATAHYEVVSTGLTGHAESVRVTYDPKVVSYGTLLRVFFSVAHDPTELDRQGPDEGTQYRSEIFAETPDQAQAARAYIAQLNRAHAFKAPIVTKVEPLKGFYPAEEHHQDFLAHNPTYPYIVINDLPKVAALKAIYPDLYAPGFAGASGA